MVTRFKKIKYSIKKYQNFNETYFISFPKSGRTWIRMFLNHYYFNCYPFSITARNRLYYDSKIPHLIFSHGAHDDYGNSSIRDIQDEVAKIRSKSSVLLVRDPRDVLVSYYFQITKRIPESALNNNIHNISDLISHENLGIKRIIDFINIWYSSYFNKKNSFIIFYEDIKNNPKKEFIELLKFLGEKEINERALLKSIDETSFDKMKAKEKENIANSKYLNATNANDDDSFKSRKGKVKGFYDYFSEEEIKKLNNYMLKLDSKLKNFYLDN